MDVRLPDGLQSRVALTREIGVNCEGGYSTLRSRRRPQTPGGDRSESRHTAHP